MTYFKSIKNNQTILLLFAIGLIWSVFSACKSFTNKEISHGTIEYTITYPNPGEITMSMDLMPKTAIYKFNTTQTCTEISAGLGALKTKVITDSNKKTIIQTLNLLGKKYKISFNDAQIDSINKTEPELKMEFLEAKKTIAGYECKKAKCTTVDESGAIINYEVYYTQGIKTEQANWFNHYKPIQGMLMKYRVKRYGITMDLTAKTVSPEGAAPEEFSLEDDYKTIPAAEMESYFKMY